MQFERIRYMDWAKRNALAPATYNLASSEIDAPDPGLYGLHRGADLRPAGPPSPFGHPGLTERLAARYGTHEDHVLTAAGTSLANFLVQAALTQPGELVMVEWPCYEPLWRTLESLGLRIQWLPRTAATGFAPDPEAIGTGFAQGARLCVLSDLHNPSATLLEREALREIAGLAARHDAWLLVDEVYLPAVFDTEVASAYGLGERVVVTCSLTKAYGLGPLRCGWAIAPPPVVIRAQQVNDHLGVVAPFIADEAGVLALDHEPALRERAAARWRENMPLLRGFAQSNALRLVPPAGSFMAWVELPDGVDGDRLAKLARERYDTQVTPGAFFGCPGHVRLGIGSPHETVKEGLHRLGLALESYAG